MAIFKAKQNVINSQVTPRVVKYFGESYTTDTKTTGIDLTPLEVLLQSILDQSDIETSGAGNTAVRFDNLGVVTKYYVRQIRDDETDTVIRTEYTNDGINWSTIVPAGTPSIEFQAVVSPVYDNQEQRRVTWSSVPAPRTTDSTDGSTLTFNANTYHSISLIVLSWAVSVTQNGKTHTFDTGYTYTYTATQLADNSITFTQASTDCVASITTITL